MNIWNKVFLCLMIAASLAVVVFAAVDMRIRYTGQKKIDSLESKLADTKAKIAGIVSGTAPLKASMDKSAADWSFEELRGQTIERYAERGRAWFGCQINGRIERKELPPALQQAAAKVVITGPIAEANAAGADAEDDGTIARVVFPESLKGIVYVFEEGTEDKAGAFLGRFTVDDQPTDTKFSDSEGNEKNGYQVVLTTADPLNDEELKRIERAARSKWTLYLTPPIDRYAGLFDQLTDEEKQAIPAELLEKILPKTAAELTEEEKNEVVAALTDEEKGNADIAKALELWSKYRQSVDDPEQAGDFSLMLDWLYQQRSRLEREIAAIEESIAVYKTAKAKNDAENQKLEQDCKLEEKRVEGMTLNRDAVQKVKAEYDAQINQLTLQIEKMQVLQAAYLAKIAEYQLKAKEKIEAEMPQR